MTARPPEAIRADLDAIEDRHHSAFERGEADWAAYARETAPLIEELERSTVPVQLRDVRAAITALDRWADQCAPGADAYLREVSARLRDASTPA